MDNTPAALFVLPDLGRNGAVQQTRAIAEGLSRSASVATTLYILNPRQDATLFSSSSLRLSFSHLDVIPVLRRLRPVSWINRRAKKLFSFFFLIVEAHRHDVLIASFEAGPALTQPFWVARLLRKPFCVIVNSNFPKLIPVHFPRWPLEKTRTILQSADHVILVSEGLKPVLLDFFGAEPLPPFSVIRNGIDLVLLEQQTQTPTICDGKRFTAPSKRYFLAVGRISTEKGLDRLILAHSNAREAGEEHLLLLAGDGSAALTAQLKALARALGVADSVCFLGYCTQPAELLRHAYGFCMTSRSEGFALALAEAAAAGIPCIAMDCIAGPREILEGGRYGDLVPDGDVAAMAQAMISHLRNPAPLLSKAAASRAHRDRFEIDTMILGYNKVIQNLALKRRPTSRQP